MPTIGFIPQVKKPVIPLPTNIASSCQLWLDASDTATITGTNPISAWTDKSGKGNNISVNGSVTYSANAVTTTLGSSYFSVPVDSRRTINPYFQVFIVFKQVSVGGNQALWGDDVGGGYNRFQFLTFASAPAQNYQLSSGSSSGVTPQIVGGLTACTSGPVVYQASYNSTGAGTTSYGYVNGSVGVAFSDSPSSSETSSTSTFFGCISSGTNVPGNVAFNEIIIYNTALSTTQRQQVEGYLAWKWNLQGSLPALHPGLGVMQPMQTVPVYIPQPIFSPKNITGCTLWLDGSDPAGTGTPPSNGATVSTWVDKSGGGNNGSGSGSYSSSGSNIVFNNTPYTLPTGTYISGSGSYTIFSIQSTNNPSGIEYFFSFGPITSAQHLSFPHAGSPSPYLSWNGNDYSFTYSMTSGRSFIAVNSYNVSSNYKYGYINGSLDGSMAPAVARNTATSPNTLGVGPNNYPLNGTLSELIIFSSFLTTTQQQQVEGYLAWKWGLQSYLPQTHLYKSAAPTVLVPKAKQPLGFIAAAPAVLPFSITSGLLAFFSFDNTLADFQNTITLVGSGSISYGSGRVAKQAVYLANESSITGGTYPTIYLRSTYNLPTTFSVSVWFKPTNTSRGNLFTSYNGFSPSNSPSNTINIYMYAGSVYIAYSHVANNGSGYSISVGTWYNAIITVNNGSFTLYMNGSQSGGTLSSTPYISGFSIGDYAENSSDFYTYAGYLDDYRIYNRVLTGSEISAIYAGTG
jgi:Concanavalin A-like lectin/glucanases superfamily